ncbi:hypothetical protein RRG08_014895 [Elysia crispata]|uniref:Uncharacterized protein n=1 Tax=Elysia crispata TaxID=231223 RepID=A0AAE0ZLQ6_9GAST|nr:hypothetical protein RRG08_014895 [Elysia crispata]
MNCLFLSASGGCWNSLKMMSSIRGSQWVQVVGVLWRYPTVSLGEPQPALRNSQSLRQTADVVGDLTPPPDKDLPNKALDRLVTMALAITKPWIVQSRWPLSEQSPGSSSHDGSCYTKTLDRPVTLALIRTKLWIV